jgi:hypothetical protein
VRGVEEADAHMAAVVGDAVAGGRLGSTAHAVRLPLQATGSRHISISISIVVRVRVRLSSKDL